MNKLIKFFPVAFSVYFTEQAIRHKESLNGDIYMAMAIATLLACFWGLAIFSMAVVE